MNTKIKLTIEISAMVIFMLAFAAMPAYANGNENGHNNGNGHNNEAPPVEQNQYQGQHQGQAQGQQQGQIAEGGSATINIGTGEGGVGGTQVGSNNNGNQGALSSNASNDGVTVEGDTSNVENNSSTVVLVPNNNTEKCLRVWGIAWGGSDNSGALGIPWRSKKCDFEQAADDAFAAGERELGWFWKCENPNLYKSFRSKGEAKESAKTDCLTKMVGGVTAARTITTQSQTIQSMLEESRRQQQLYTEQSELIAESCGDANERMHAMCQAK